MPDDTAREILSAPTDEDKANARDWAAARRPPLFGSWLERTRALQLKAYGADLHALEGDAYAEHVRMNVTAIVSELGEFLNEIDWKTWTKTRGRPGVEERARALVELVDVLHFVANLLVGLRVSDLELRLAYAEKMYRNEERQATGTYDRQSDKCPYCKRALDDVGSTMVTDKMMACDACGRSWLI